MQVSRDPTILPVGAARLQLTNATDFRFPGIVHSTILARKLFPREPLVSRAAKRIRLFLIVKLVPVEQMSTALVVHRAVGGHVRQDALRFTGFGLLAIGIPR